MTQTLTLVSHRLCPYVQRAVIVLLEKGVAFKRVDIDLGNKPDWFLKVSPLGKTPVLLVADEPIFESAVICEYLDETTTPSLHPTDALLRARHRGWIEFGSVLLNAIAGFYTAADEAEMFSKVADIRGKFERIEEQLTSEPYFAGERFCIVDAVFGPVFRYFDVFEQFDDFGFVTNMPGIAQWRRALAARPSVIAAADPAYPALLRAFLSARNSALSKRINGRLA